MRIQCFSLFFLKHHKVGITVDRNIREIILDLHACLSFYFDYCPSGGASSGGTSGKEFTCQCRRCRRCGFYPWVGKISWRRKWQPTPVFLPGKSHGQRSLEDDSPGRLQALQRVWRDFWLINNSLLVHQNVLLIIFSSWSISFWSSFSMSMWVVNLLCFIYLKIYLFLLSLAV